MLNQIINEVPVVIAGGPGEGFVMVLDAAKKGNLLAIMLLAASALILAYSAWRFIRHLFRTPKTAKWRLWRTIGLISLVCVPFSCLAIWFWNKESILIAIVPQIFLFLSAISSDSCRKENALFHSTDQ
ncbi:MAG: hypothetical protein ACK5OB_14830 [Pirellula sp.]